MEHSIALVTGATSGLGHAVARVLAGESYRQVTVTGRSLSRIQETVSHLAAETKTQVFTPLGLDLNSPTSVQTAVAELVRLGRPIDFLLLNAGRIGGKKLVRTAAGITEHEMTLRQQKRFEARARTAKLRHLASVEDIDYRTARGLDRTLFLTLANCDWIREHRHCLLTGTCGVGKSWLACALGYQACRENLSVLYQRVPRLFALLALGRGDGRYAKLMRQLARVDLAHPRRLGARTAATRTATRSAGNRRGPLQRRLADHHQTASGRPLV